MHFCLSCRCHATEKRLPVDYGLEIFFVSIHFVMTYCHVQKLSPRCLIPLWKVCTSSLQASSLLAEKRLQGGQQASWLKTLYTIWPPRQRRLASLKNLFCERADLLSSCVGMIAALTGVRWQATFTAKGERICYGNSSFCWKNDWLTGEINFNIPVGTIKHQSA